MDLTIQRAVLHWVSRQASGVEAAQGVTLSDDYAPLERKHTTFLVERMQASLTSDWAREVELDQNNGASPIPSLVLRSLRDPDPSLLLAMSHTCALDLYEKQHKMSPPGLLVVAQCTDRERPCLAITKLEQEEGARAIKITENGRIRYAVELLDDLILTRKTKVFKNGLFWREDDGGVDRVLGLVSDHQQGYRQRSEVAIYFMEKYLGGRLLVTPTVATSRFLNVAERFINAIEDPELRWNAYIHYTSLLTDQRDAIMPREFAARTFPSQQEQAFLRKLEEEGIGLSSFRKDMAVIEAGLSRTIVEFENRLRVIGPRASFDESTKTEILDDGRAKMEITDYLAKVGRPR